MKLTKKYWYLFTPIFYNIISFFLDLLSGHLLTFNAYLHAFLHYCAIFYGALLLIELFIYLRKKFRLISNK